MRVFLQPMRGLAKDDHRFGGGTCVIVLRGYAAPRIPVQGVAPAAGMRIDFPPNRLT